MHGRGRNLRLMNMILTYRTLRIWSWPCPGTSSGPEWCWDQKDLTRNCLLTPYFIDFTLILKTKFSLTIHV